MNCSFPVLFVSHGAPTFALNPGLAGAKLADVGINLSKASAIIILSPHWMTQGGILVGAEHTNKTIHDFSGFPDLFYKINYPASGDPVLAEVVVDLLKGAGVPADIEVNRGLDHGAWIPLLHLFPKAEIPVVQLSMPAPLDPIGAFLLGEILKPLRKRNVLIIGSGNLTHNLSELRSSDVPPMPYVSRFLEWVRQAIFCFDIPALIDYRNQAPDAAQAHPTDEHFLPLLFALGAAGKNCKVDILEGGVVHGALAMDSILFSPD